MWRQKINQEKIKVLSSFNQELSHFYHLNEMKAGFDYSLHLAPPGGDIKKYTESHGLKTVDTWVDQSVFMMLKTML